MPDAVLLFTFGPVQPFIMEARRAADLFAGSRILVELARAAAAEVQRRGGRLVFPMELGNDVPNRLVAIVAAQEAGEVAAKARQALLARWDAIARTGRRRLQDYGAGQDEVWNATWDRQVARVWEVFWAAAPMAEGAESYAAAYQRADRALRAAKRTRAFEPAEEPGLKDSLSGRREALRTAQADARAYWAQLGQAPGMTAARLRPDGRERLDAIGAIKRFSDIAEAQSFLSTSSVASQDFLERAHAHLGPYRRAIEALIPPEKLYAVRGDGGWPYDGDLFYTETLTPGRLQASYGVEHPDAAHLQAAQQALVQLYRSAGSKPSPYYAVVVLDGDRMGERIGGCLEQPGRALELHRKLGRDLAAFAQEVPKMVGDAGGALIYNGGDDVLLLAPLARGLALANALAQAFRRNTGGSASAGVAIAHHLSPLDAALAAARAAEQTAKNHYGRNALCVRALKRSGETLQVGSKWSVGGAGQAASMLDGLVEHFREDRLSSRLAYELAAEGAIATALPNTAREAVLRRLVHRHRSSQLERGAAAALLTSLTRWAAALDDCVPAVQPRDGARIPQGLAELGRWVVLARFIAQGGGD